MGVYASSRVLASSRRWGRRTGSLRMVVHPRPSRRSRAHAVPLRACVSYTASTRLRAALCFWLCTRETLLWWCTHR